MESKKEESNLLQEFPLVNFYLMSDLHLEFYANHLQLPNIPLPDFSGKAGRHVCLLAGDIGYPTLPNYRKFLQVVKDKFDDVIVIAGNHEFYARGKKQALVKVETILKQIQKICQETGCIFLDRQAYTLPLTNTTGRKITILGCTLWSYIKPEEYCLAKDGLNDFSKIYVGHGNFLLPKNFTEWHQRDRDWLSQEITSRQDEDLVILTHHCPTLQIIDPIYQDHPLNCCFVTNLEDLFTNNVRLWACGHSHKRNICQVKSGWCGLNPYGYPRENKLFSPLIFSLFKGDDTKLIM